jgi:hypothetical protein
VTAAANGIHLLRLLPTTGFRGDTATASCDLACCGATLLKKLSIPFVENLWESESSDHHDTFGYLRPIVMVGFRYVFDFSHNVLCKYD